MSGNGSERTDQGWALSAGGNDADRAWAIAADGKGNSYLPSNEQRSHRMRTVTIVGSLVLLVALGAACGGDEIWAPVLTDLKMPDTITRGALTQGTVRVGDGDGLGGLEVHIWLTGPVNVPRVTTPVQGVSDDLVTAEVPFQLTLATTSPAGRYAFYISASDGDDITGNELYKPVEVN